MDFTHIDTISSFKQRAQPLALRDIWYPLVLDESLAKENKHIHQLWDALNISFDAVSYTHLTLPTIYSV